ncbi:hypothetical protein PsYK624_163900 [Phanerochaete sordida]|uniref:Uncharacterized protein n=1 Tax=Phanerochaete sordida TaxID=48140 RepID=A0A9P3GVU6_9APHY|nr:hypothetical protein PsYK624_163900 [Phanerochaete sordida]
MPKPQSAQTDYLAAMRRDLTWFEHALPEAGRLACRLGVEQRSEELWRRDALEELRARIPAQATVVHELLDSIAERAREDRKTMRALEGELGAAFRAIESKVEAVESSLAKHLHQLEEAKQHKTSRTKALLKELQDKLSAKTKEADEERRKKCDEYAKCLDAHSRRLQAEEDTKHFEAACVVLYCELCHALGTVDDLKRHQNAKAQPAPKPHPAVKTEASQKAKGAAPKKKAKIEDQYYDARKDDGGRFFQLFRHIAAQARARAEAQALHERQMEELVRKDLANAQRRAEDAERRAQMAEEKLLRQQEKALRAESKIEALKEEVGEEMKKTEESENALNRALGDVNRLRRVLEVTKKNQASEIATYRLQHASRTYDTLWSILDNPALSFATIPWPTVEAPQTPEEITPESIRDFLLSEARRDGRSKLEVAKKERTRWHPDKWVTKLERTQESEKVNVKRGIDLVASYLNDLVNEVCPLNQD